MQYKKINHFLLFATILVTNTTAFSNQLLKLLDIGQKNQSKSLFTTKIEEKQKQLDIQKSKLEKTGSKETELSAWLNTNLTAVNNEIKKLEEIKAQTPNKEFINKQLALLNESYQTIVNIQQVSKEIPNTIEQSIKELEEYLKDPNFKNLKIQPKSVYTIKDFQDIKNNIVFQESKKNTIEDKIKNLKSDLETRKKAITNTQKDCDSLKKQQQEFKAQSTQKESGKAEDKFSVIEQGKILDLTKQLADFKLKLAETNLNETTEQLTLANIKSFIINAQLGIFAENLKLIRYDFRINPEDIEQEEANVTQKKEKLLSSLKDIYKKIEALTESLNKNKEILNQLSQEYKIPVSTEFTEWTISPKSASEFLMLTKIGELNESIRLASKQKELLESQQALESIDYKKQEINLETIKSLQRINQKLFKSDEEITIEIKKYDAPLIESSSNISLYKEKIISITSDLNLQNKILENINKIQEKLKSENRTLFREQQKKFNDCLTALENAATSVKEIVSIDSKLIESYTQLITQSSYITRQIDQVVASLKSEGLWYRPKTAVSWEGVLNIPKDLESFIYEIRNMSLLYLPKFKTDYLLGNIKDVSSDPYSMLRLLLEFLLLILLFGLIKNLLPKLNNFLQDLSNTHSNFKFIGTLLSIIIVFLQKHLLGLFVFFILFLSSHMGWMPDLYITVMFYILSIPYLLYLFNSFINFFAQENIKNNRILLSENYESHFLTVISVLANATIIISLLREAYILLNPAYKSEFSTILLALNFIIFQISLIFLISKEQILNIIPTKTDTWKWIHEQIGTFYYVLLIPIITVIVLSNPYVGFVKLVVYAVQGIIYTLTLVTLLYWLNKTVRFLLSKILFYTDVDVVKERFAYSKTWYGLTVILTFIGFLLIGLLIGAQIWGGNISLDVINHWLKAKLFNTGLVEDGVDIPFTIYSAIKLATFIFSGIVVSAIINKYVLQRVFDILPVDSGVQNATTAIMRFILITLTTIIGFNTVGLAGLLLYALGALLALGVALKEIIQDFAAYFIILVQRPIKVGDYIKVDENTMGVVRKITPRSTVLRRKNSITLIVPNSQIINKSVTNWNYARTFIAFDDITVRVPYSNDAKQIVQLIREVLENNPYILKTPPAVIRLEDFTEGGFEFLVRAFISAHNVLNQWQIASDIRLEIAAKLRENNIEIGVPVRILKMLKNDDLLK
ncbi:MAG: hypothetical protein UR26_C0002G0178 [candidate division TM6 bacterium GW2011_GWF2_32_72]|nr:MAG: hypothetical protein UR26_C0002G0178 [candidate division TM6 bacterium GW2011_GWF2_32_72]